MLIAKIHLSPAVTMRRKFHSEGYLANCHSYPKNKIK
jgi:hypothetical protein